MDTFNPNTPIATVVDLGFADFTVVTRDDGTVIASSFDSVEKMAAGRPYVMGEVPGPALPALESWLKGDFASLMEVPVQYSGTPKLVQLRQELRNLPAGTVVTYKQLAEQAGLPTLPRLAGRACSTNPCLLFVPCHRVVSTAHIGPPVIPGQYAGSTEFKAKILAHEGVEVGTETMEDSSGF